MSRFGLDDIENPKLVVARISDYAWEHAAAGTYSDTITFTASLETANAAG